MKNLLILSALLSLAVFAGCQSAAPIAISKDNGNSSAKKIAVTTPTPDPHEEAMAKAPRITLEDAKKAFDAKEAVFIDSRSQSAFDVEHVAGAINIPMLAPEAEYSKIPKGKKIIIYCS
ncbi:MAG TPA: rhodanese-like domain-containing protein [Pyrinomonadaceae bacterium]|nr:rhodanese-like domain-containing protein [Pyrinomonadaceae bacterium]